MESKNLDFEQLSAIGCDGTATNTGWNNGVIHNIGVKLGRPMQWLMYLLHFNKLPCRHLFQHLDGETSGLKSFSKKIGKQLAYCEKLPVAMYEIIDGEDTNVMKNDVSKDQQYLRDIYRAVKTGECTPELAVKDPGPLNHSRWLICANSLKTLHFRSESFV